MKQLFLLASLLVFASCSTQKSATSNIPLVGYDAELTAFQYPFDVHFYQFESQDQKMKMAYMDIKPAGEVKKTVVMFHGKNFSGYYFEPIIKELREKGFRVIVPDQIGFGKSTKPTHFQYSFQTLAQNTKNLLDSIGVKEFTLVGHSMGGMLATRFSLMFPDMVKKLVLVNPIGLEDYKTLTTYKPFEELYANELKSNEASIRNYQVVFYYDGKWKEEYEPMIKPAIEWTRGKDHALIARNSALTTELIINQPVYYEFKNLKVPMTLINGDRDKTAPGKGWAPKENQPKMGNYPKLGREIVRMTPRSKLVELKGLGHMPFVEDFAGFMKVFVKEL